MGADAMMLSILLWFWQGPGGAWGRYKVAHVNRAARMIRANLKCKHEIVCITDLAADAEQLGFEPGIRVVQLWPDLADRGRCWRRLKAFAPGMEKLLGERWAWIDLDCVVLGDLTPLFERDEDLVLWQSQSTRAYYNGSMVLHRAGSMPDIWERYNPSIDMNPSWPGSDQAWFCHYLGGDMPVWTARDGIYAFNRYGRKWRREPPAHARILFFPGSIKPNSHICQKLTPWIQGVLNQYGEVDEPAYHWTPHARRTRIKRRQQRYIRTSRAGVTLRV
jgi:hypothetical protein